MKIENIEKIVRKDLESCWLRVRKEKMYILFHMNENYNTDKIAYEFRDSGSPHIAFNFNPYSNIVTRFVWRC